MTVQRIAEYSYVFKVIALYLKWNSIVMNANEYMITTDIYGISYSYFSEGK